jgi:Ca2+-binding EF-hand superfamily protein
MSSDASTTASTSTMPPSATSGPETATNGASADNSQARKIFDQLDLNHDGSLSFQEFSRATFESK